MEVRPGYKQTEGGVIPQDWETSRLGELSEFITSGSRGWAAYYSDHGALFIRSQNVRAGRLDFTDTQFVQPPSGAERNRTRLNRSDLLITITGNSVGNVALVEHDVGEAYISQHVGMVRLLDPKLAQYICRFLSPGSPGNGQIWGSQSGQSKPGLTLQNLKDFWVALAPTEEQQRAIVDALGDVDALLDGLDRLIAKKRDLKRAGMQQLLTGQIRLPGFHGEWNVDRFGAVVERVFPKSTLTSGDGLESGSFPLFVSGGEPKRTEIAQFRDAEALVFSDGGVFGVKRAVGSFSVTDHCFVVALHPKAADMRWFEDWFTLHSQQMDRLTFKGSGLRNLDKLSLGDIEIRSPDREEQTAISGVLSDMEAEIAALERRRNKTHDIKRAMMQELLTGKTPLVPAGAAYA